MRDIVRDKKNGLLLQKHREHLGLSVPELSDKLQLNSRTPYMWESGGTTIPSNKAGTLAYHLNLTAGTEAEEFISAINPKVCENVGPSWLRQKLREENWRHINYPAFDPDWLEAQPKLHQAGLLMKAYREDYGLSQPDIAAAIGVKFPIISLCESGRRNIPVKRFDALATVLNLTPDEKVYFREIIDLSQDALRIHNVENSLGATIEAAKVTELLPEVAHTRGR